MAAGKGTRMKSTQPKVLHAILGKPLIYYVVAEVLKLRPYVSQVIVVVGHKGKEVETALRALFPKPKAALEFVSQGNPQGTAHAVSCALKKIRSQNVLVLCGDAPLIRAETLKHLCSSFLRRKSVCTLLSAYLDERNSPGVVVRDSEGNIKAIQEKAGLDAVSLEKIQGSLCLQEANSGIYVFDYTMLVENIKKIARNKRKNEYFLTDIIEILYAQGAQIDSFLLKDGSEILGINTQIDLDEAAKIMRLRIINELRSQAVTIVDADTTFIAPNVRIGKNTIIYPFTFIEEGVIIGRHCQLGPFLRIRGKTRIADNTHLGNFLEVNRCQIRNKVRAKHFGYLGDTYVGDKVNIGAGTVVANYDGHSKHKSKIGQGAFIGSDTVLIAPVSVGKYAATGAGSVVTRDVKDKTIVLGNPARLYKRNKKR